MQNLISRVGRLATLMYIHIFLSACVGGGGGSTELRLLLQSQTQQTAVLSVLLKDANQQALAYTNVSLRFQNDNNATLSAHNVLTNANGTAEVIVTHLLLENAEVWVEAQYADISANVRIQFNDGIAAPDVLTPQRLKFESDTYLLAVNDSSEVRVQVLAENDQALAGQTLYFNVDGSAQLSQSQAISDTNGRASFTFTNAKAENNTLTVQVGNISQTLRFYVGAKLQLTPSKQNALTEATLTAILKDAQQSPLLGQALHFNFIGDNQATLSPVNSETASDGSAIVKVNDIAGLGGNIQVQVSGGTLKAQALVQFLSNTGDGSQLLLSSDNLILAANQTARIRAQLQDIQNLPIAAKAVRFYVNDSFYSEVLSDSQGQAILELNADASNLNVRAESGAASQSLNLYFGAQLNWNANVSQALPNGADSIDLLMRLSDYQNHSIAGANVYFQVASGTATLDKFSAITDAEGQASLSVSANVVNSPLIQAQVDSITPASVRLNFANADVASQASRLILSSALDTPINLSLNGNAPLQIRVEDNHGVGMAGVLVQLSTTGIGTVTNAVTTDNNGLASATFSAGSQAGLSSVIASSNDLSAELNIRIQPGEAGTIEVLSIQPEDIGIIGSGQNQTSNLQFILKDIRGNPVADGTPVNFSLGDTRLGGGEQIFTDNNQGAEVTALTINGIASVSLRSGLVAGTVDVIANSGEINTLARVSIIGALPDADHLSIAAEYLNIAGGRTLNLEDNITVQLADRFGNTVASQTPVNFISEGGVIGLSQNAGGFESSNDRGQIVALLRSSDPTTPNLGGIQPQGNLGLNRIVAYTTGSESFQDNNGNGFYDAGDSFSQAGFVDDNQDGRWNPGERITAHGDMSEPFIDGNDNQIFENGEFYVDVNGNGQFDGPDGVFQANTTIWRSMNVLFSDNLDLRSFFTCPDAGANFQLQLQDTYGNALVAGTQFSAALGEGSANAILSGTSKLQLGDRQDLGNTLTLNVTGRKLAISNVISKAVDVTVTMTLTPPTEDNPAGRNFDEILEYSCTVTVITDVEKPAENPVVQPIQ